MFVFLLYWIDVRPRSRLDKKSQIPERLCPVANKCRERVPRRTTTDAVSQVGVFQTKRVRDYRYRAEAHGCCCDDWRKKDAEKWVEDTGCYRHTCRVVNEREEEVLFDVAHRLPAEVSCTSNGPEISFDESNSGAFHRHVCAGAHRNANLSLSKGWSVVNTISCHGDETTFGLKALHHIYLLIRENLCN